MNGMWAKFKTGLLFVNLFEKFIPSSKMTETKYSMPWIDVTIERLVKNRQKLHLRASKDIDEMNHFKRSKHTLTEGIERCLLEIRFKFVYV